MKTFRDYINLIESAQSGRPELRTWGNRATGETHYSINGVEVDRDRYYQAWRADQKAKGNPDIKEQGVAEGEDQVKKVFKDKSGKPVGEIGIDPESSPGNGEWYVHHYATGYSVVGFDSAAEAKRELMYVHKHPDAVEGHPSTKEQGVAEASSDAIARVEQIASKK